MLFVSSKDVIGPFQLLRQIRSGVTAQIWEVRHKGEKDRSAIKVLKFKERKNREEIEALKQEGIVGKSLKHPNVIEIYDFHGDLDQPLLHMELFPGKNLKQLLQSNHDAIKKHIDKIVRQCCESLVHLHSHQWVHCDLKPDNFLINEKVLVKLIDFSIAKPFKQGFKLFGSKKIQGTRSYMAPEQIRGKKVDVRTDIYGLGCVMHELVAGRPPFTGANSDQLLQKHLKSPPPSLQAADKRVRKEYAELVLRMLAKEPEKRPQSMDEILKAVSKSKVFRATVKPKTDQPPE